MTGQGQPRHDDLDKIDQMILYIVEANESIPKYKLLNKIDGNENTKIRHLARLLEDGHLQEYKKGRHTRYLSAGAMPEENLNNDLSSALTCVTEHMKDLRGRVSSCEYSVKSAMLGHVVGFADYIQRVMDEDNRYYNQRYDDRHELIYSKTQETLRKLENKDIPEVLRNKIRRTVMTMRDILFRADADQIKHELLRHSRGKTKETKFNEFDSIFDRTLQDLNGIVNFLDTYTPKGEKIKKTINDMTKRYLDPSYGKLPGVVYVGSLDGNQMRQPSTYRPRSGDLDYTDWEILTVVEQRPGIGQKMIMDRLLNPSSTVERRLKRLIGLGYLHKYKTGKRVEYAAASCFIEDDLVKLLQYHLDRAIIHADAKMRNVVSYQYMAKLDIPEYIQSNLSEFQKRIKTAEQEASVTRENWEINTLKEEVLSISQAAANTKPKDRRIAISLAEKITHKMHATYCDIEESMRRLHREREEVESNEIKRNLDKMYDDKDEMEKDLSDLKSMLKTNSESNLGILLEKLHAKYVKDESIH